MVLNEKYEFLINGLIEDEFGMLEEFFPRELLLNLRSNAEQYYQLGLMAPAGIGRKFSYEKNAKVRGDLIRWIDNNSDDQYEKAFLESVHDFISYLNQSCYTGINDFEFHYAFYDEGSFYRRHKDQFNNDFGRKFSLVSYLNEDWKSADGGQLVVYTQQSSKKIEPRLGTTVFFRSDVTEHEVLLSHAPRFSIAGWLKKV
ncbi:MAG: 2OG-Fe(II) oxygenase [Saprospiraceae bacterium]|nr:2OG-Fe(II) oxygenase [Saprospiraceae bacterium]MCB9328462.1 2OG-Fe(II) oxygenase [Lewinellaceae bacterium]HPK10877.1 2OG-Fe(II) oxygenase [Saprospiraceae bacterium]